MVERRHRTIEEWERTVGEQVRAARIARYLDQQHLSGLADVSVGAISNLERGKGSSLKTLVAVVRALDQTDWLEGLAPEVSVSPMQLLLAKHKSQGPRMRVRASRAIRSETDR